MKLDAVYLAENEEVLLASGYFRKLSTAQQSHHPFSNRFNNYNF